MGNLKTLKITKNGSSSVAKVLKQKKKKKDRFVIYHLWGVNT
jgi:hypothetical protein